MADISKIDFGDGVERNVKDAQARTDIAAKENLKLASSGTTASGEIRFGVDGQGNYGYIKAGADTVTPFRTGSSNLQVKTTTVTPTQGSDGETDTEVISPDSGYDGMSQVNLKTPQVRKGTTLDTDSVVNPSTYYVNDTERQNTHGNLLKVVPTKTGMVYRPSGGGVTTPMYVLPTASMGNATAADVRQGKTFTSGSGIAQTGTMVGGHTYGAIWSGGSSPAMTRTDDAVNFSNPNPYYSGMSGTPSSPFDNKMPWSGIRRVTDADAGELVEYPKFWWKMTFSNGSIQTQISDYAKSGYHVSPLHADRGDGVGERDYGYIGRYPCCGVFGSDVYKSKSGVSPYINCTRAEARTSIHQYRGTNAWQWDAAAYWTVALLYLVEFANWDSQAMIGYGCGNNSAVGSTGLTDTMPYHTGTMQSSRTTYGNGVQYRYLEGLWNVFQWIDGIYFDGANGYCIKNPANFSDTTGGTLVGSRTQDSGFIKSFSDPSAVTGFEYALLPASADNNLDGTTYICDKTSNYSQGAWGVTARVGYGYSQYLSGGLFCMYCGSQANAHADDISCRLMVLPSAQLT